MIMICVSKCMFSCILNTNINVRNWKLIHLKMENILEFCFWNQVLITLYSQVNSSDFIWLFKYFYFAYSNYEILIFIDSLILIIMQILKWHYSVTMCTKWSMTPLLISQYDVQNMNLQEYLVNTFSKYFQKYISILKYL